MSINKILKEKRRQTRKKGAGIVAHDSMITGDEPVWTGWENWPLEKFFKEHARALRFYNYYCKAKELKKDIVEWMRAAGDYTATDMNAVKAALDTSPGIVVGSLCRCINRGMPPLHPRADEYVKASDGRVTEIKSDEVFIRERIALAISDGASRSMAKSNGGAKAKRSSPLELLEKKLQSTILADLDRDLLDKLVENASKPKSVKFDLYKRLQDCGVPKNGLVFVKQWLDKQYDEMATAYNGEDDQVVEGYSFLTKPQLYEWIALFDAIYVDLEKYRASLKSAKVPRAKKTLSAEKQIAKLKYCKTDPDLKLVSISPEKIIGASSLYVYNTKYRQMIAYFATDQGFAIKGTSLQNVDEAKTRGIKLRKPDEFIPIVLSKTAKQIDNAWAKLTTKEFTPNSRINENCVLLRTVEV